MYYKISSIYQQIFVQNLQFQRNETLVLSKVMVSKLSKTHEMSHFELEKQSQNLFEFAKKKFQKISGRMCKCCEMCKLSTFSRLVSW